MIAPNKWKFLEKEGDLEREDILSGKDMTI